MTDYAERSKQLLFDKTDCTRAIVAAFDDITNLYAGTTTQPATQFQDKDTSHDLCGAIHGMSIVVGKIYGPKSYRAKAIVSKLTRKFRKKFGALMCCELSPDTEQGQVPTVDRMPLCSEYVGYAAEILVQQLREDGII